MITSSKGKKQENKKEEARSKKQFPQAPVRPSGPCCLAVAQAPFWVRQLGFLVGSESHVRYSRPWLAGPVRLSGPCCLAVAQAPFWVRQLGFVVGSESNVRHSRPWPGSSEGNVWHRGLPAAGPIRPSVPWCLGPAEGSFDRTCAGRTPAARGHGQASRKPTQLAVGSAGRQGKARFEASF